MHIPIANTKSHFYYKNEQNVASIKMVVFLRTLSILLFL